MQLLWRFVQLWIQTEPRPIQTTTRFMLGFKFIPSVNIVNTKVVTCIYYLFCVLEKTKGFFVALDPEIDVVANIKRQKFV